MNEFLEEYFKYFLTAPPTVLWWVFWWTRFEPHIKIFNAYIDKKWDHYVNKPLWRWYHYTIKKQRKRGRKLSS